MQNEENQNAIEEAKETLKQIKFYENEISKIFTLSKEHYLKIESFADRIRQAVEFLTHLEVNINQINTNTEHSNIAIEKIELLLKSSLEYSQKISKLDKEIFGFSEVDESGNPITTSGTKQKIENSYNELTDNFNNWLSIVKNELSQAKMHIDFLETNTKEEYEKHFIKWNNDFEHLIIKIRELLPNALTAGLSHAYEEKRKAEQIESEKHNTNYKRAIYALCATSALPIVISLFNLYNSSPINEVVKNLPNYASAIIPLYIPILWLAYNSGKKVNLSKRLIEEYYHKEVLSKTYEGLSTQIDKFSNNDKSQELRIKLLSNILNVSNENPGKLIQDYNTADHPLIDALDKSVQLGNALSKIENIPGFKLFAEKLAKKSEKILDENEEKAKKGLETES